MGVRMMQRRGTAAQWEAVNPVLGDGEIGVEKDTGIIKVGDGVAAWMDLEIAFRSQDLVLSVFGRTGEVTAVANDISDATEIGLALMTAVDQADARDIIGADAGNVIGTGVTAMVAITQANYTALATKDPTTLYVIVG